MIVRCFHSGLASVTSPSGGAQPSVFSTAVTKVIALRTSPTALPAARHEHPAVLVAVADLCTLVVALAAPAAPAAVRGGDDDGDPDVVDLVVRIATRSLTAMRAL